ncbi:sulfotransferase [Psychrobium sp. 1_MG-2023]|uniref:tetratricopeptide repeat-containing sulfotransferase family protein n=1 Tax=Psychrobium sp. 1_MG-2023 TaxID=3062624 RepID=UPI000C332219|nr:sulfotransferase [Psychrobium sp. 1_MG-2023]MDP2560382.1 sulfotransferase [Psychrobium sp. 1_MG-2023]PKF55492.1 hypothetical protein CW748_13435 [Alteromonadales bacterium alter-6D02]
MNTIVENALNLHKQGEMKKAHDAYHAVLRVNPKHPQALHYLGLMAQQNGHSMQAVTLIERSITIEPDDIRAYNHLAQVYLAIGKSAKAQQVLEEGIRRGPNHIDTLNTLANILVDNEQLKKAIKVYRQVVELAPKVDYGLFNLAQALKEARDYQESLHWYKNTLAIQPNHIKALHGAGITSEELGKFEDAITFYLRVLAIEPEHVRSLANIISIKSFTPQSELINTAVRVARDTSLNAEDKAKLNNGLGKYFDSVGQYDKAFVHFKTSCLAQKSFKGEYNAEFNRQLCNRIINAFNKPLFENIAKGDVCDLTPVFIIGMPRSGTTLAEQILASHENVFGCGELTVIPKLSKQVLGSEHDDVRALTEQALNKALKDYCDNVRSAGIDKETFFTDKLPMNFMYLGLIAAIFPKAKIVYCKRDPLDIGLSCYIEMFSLVNDFSVDLNAFGDYFLDHDRMMSHWQRVLPLDIFELRYESLISDQEGVTRGLLEFVGLEWDSQCMQYHTTQRAVNTPSRWQVRQPMYQSSSKRWKHYETQLSPLRERLSVAGYKYN